MSNQLVAIYNSVTALVQASFPSAKTTYRVYQGAWRDWRDEIVKGESGGGMDTPFNVIGFREAQPEADGPLAATMYKMPVEIYHVRDLALTDAERATYMRVEDLLLPLGENFRDVLIARDRSVFDDGWQLTDENPRVDTSDTNPANMLFMDMGEQFFSVQVSFSLWFGEPYQ